MPVLEESEAKRRAALVFEALHEARFDMELSWQTIAFPGVLPMGVPVYDLSESGFSVHHGQEKPLAKRADGMGLNRGDLFKLARACHLRAKFMPGKAWSKDERSRLRTHEHHCALVEELLWLGRFRDPCKVERDKKLQPKVTNKDVDFQFRSQSFTVNLEVKFRKNTWVPRVTGEFETNEVSALYRDVDGKFPIPGYGEVNLVAVTGYAPADEEFTAATEDFLDQHPEISGVIYWCDHAPTGRSWRLVSKTTRLPELLLQIDPEESFRAYSIRHPSLNPKTGRPTYRRSAAGARGSARAKRVRDRQTRLLQRFVGRRH